MSGMEVEDLRPVAPPFTRRRRGRDPRAPSRTRNADRLRVCQVERAALGDGRCRSSAARRMRAPGMKVPLAMVGAELPPGEDGKPFKIGVGKLRGVESRGMLCSARELKIADDHGGLLELAADAPVGADIRELAAARRHRLHAQAHAQPGACAQRLRHRARSLGADRRAAAARRPSPPCRRRTTSACRWRCRRPTCAAASRAASCAASNTQAKTPAWMVERLARCGQRSVTALVDISNYVMFEYGRPSHIFDLDKIHDRLVVRWGRAGRDAEAAQRQHDRARRQRGRDRRRAGRRVAGRHHGRRRHGGVRRHDERLRRGRLLVARGGAGPLAPLQLHHRCRPPLRARRRPGADGGAHRAHHAADHRHLRRRGRPDGRPGAAPARGRSR